MSLANETRGELSLTLEGVEYGLRPSHEAQEAIETALGKSCEMLALAADNGRMTLHENATVAGAFLRAWGVQVGDKTVAAFNDKRLKAVIVEEGSMLVSRRLGIALYMAISGGVTATGEVKPVTTTSPSPAPDVAAA
ncbi:hypothetical protein U1839_06075 [Sphingomonas sp. RT2P30]|uniref:hypothetical protein n=1 Tax=Parasphingomonas halimpatiens TaxID=3096162 RepID=UPI002FC93D18